MSNLARQYTILEVKRLLDASEGRGPGTGGHAMAEHGHLRDDVTDRGKPNDSAFQQTIKILDRTLVAPNGPGTTRPVTPMDQSMVVAFALNSEKGQDKLKALDLKPDVGTFGNAIQTEMKAIASILPELRIGHGDVESSGRLPKIKIELFKIDGRLHIHTAYGMA